MVFLLVVMIFCCLILYNFSLLYVLIVFYFYCFFFFKHKTAYDRRISDWSSDVCSSDLIHGALVATPGRQDTAHLGVDLGASLANNETTTANRQCGVPTGVCGKQAMDGLRRRVRHGCLPSRGACPGRDDAVSEARARTVRLSRDSPSFGSRTFFFFAYCPVGTTPLPTHGHGRSAQARCFS